MPALGHAVDGALRGWDFADREIDENENQQLRREQITLDNQHRRRGLEMREEELDMARQRENRYSEEFAYNKQRQAVADERADTEWGWRQEDREEASRLLDDQEFQERGKLAWQSWVSSGRFDPEFAKEAQERGAKEWLPSYWMDHDNLKSTLEASKMLEGAMRSGNLGSLNSPEFLRNINQMYSGRIRRGIGEVNQATGQKIVDKRIAGFELTGGDGRNGRVMPILEVTLEDGSTYKAPPTRNASSAEGDTIVTEDPAALFDDLLGRGQMAKVMMQKSAMMAADGLGFNVGLKPQAQYQPQSTTGKILSDRDQLAPNPNDPDRQYFDQALEGATGGGSGGGAMSPGDKFKSEVRAMKDLLAADGIQLSNQQAIDYLENRFDVGRFISDYVERKLDEQNDWTYQGEKLSEDELIRKGQEHAARIQEMRQMKSPAQQRAAEQQQSREQAIKRIMESNPNKTREQVEAYYDHLKSQGKL